MVEVEHSNHSGWNDAKILQETHRLYTELTAKKFELKHRYEMLKDQLKWRAICDPPKSESENPTLKRLEMKLLIGVKDLKVGKPQRE